MTDFDLIAEYLPFLIPLVLLQVGLMTFAIVHICKHPHYRFGNKPMWLLIVIFINILGPIIYFVFGKDDGE